MDIAATLAPLQPLRNLGHDVVVVDGSSTDATRALAAPLADRVLSAPGGRGGQMNASAALARGEALVFLHADTRLPKRAALLIADALRWRRWGRFDVRIADRSPLAHG